MNSAGWRSGITVTVHLTAFAPKGPSPRPSPRIRLRPKAGFGGQESGAREKVHSTSSGHGTMVDFTVFIAMASATARPMPSSVNG